MKKVWKLISVGLVVGLLVALLPLSLALAGAVEEREHL